MEKITENMKRARRIEKLLTGHFSAFGAIINWLISCITFISDGRIYEIYELDLSVPMLLLMLLYALMGSHLGKLLGISYAEKVNKIWLGEEEYKLYLEVAKKEIDVAIDCENHDQD